MLRTQPTIFSPSRATYCRNGAFLPSFSLGIGRDRVALPKRAAISGVLTTSVFAGDATCPAIQQGSRGQLGIVLDGVVLSAPSINQANFERDQITISGSFNQESADSLAISLRFGSLPVELRPQQSETVSATLGKGALQAGIISGLIGLVLVLGYLAIYYRLLGLITAVSIPLSFYLPSLTARLDNPAPLIVVLVLLYPLGYLGLLLAPVAGAWLWAVVIGTATSVFPVALTLIGLRARTSAGTAALSGFTQGVGYLLASIGPFGVGILHDASDGWTVPLIALMLLSVPQLVTGLLVSRRRYVEDVTA